MYYPFLAEPGTWTCIVWGNRQRELLPSSYPDHFSSTLWQRAKVDPWKVKSPNLLSNIVREPTCIWYITTSYSASRCRLLRQKPFFGLLVDGSPPQTVEWTTQYDRYQLGAPISPCLRKSVRAQNHATGKQHECRTYTTRVSRWDIKVEKDICECCTFLFRSNQKYRLLTEELCTPSPISS